MVYEAIRELVRYGLEKGLITEDDAIYARNQILEVLKMDEYEEPALPQKPEFRFLSCYNTPLPHFPPASLLFHTPVPSYSTTDTL